MFVAAALPLGEEGGQPFIGQSGCEQSGLAVAGPAPKDARALSWLKSTWRRRAGAGRSMLSNQVLRDRRGESLR